MNKIRPWVQAVVPLVYQDSLSYLEMLHKVIDTLNEIIARTNDLDSFVKANLKTVLDQMVEDGSLSQMVQECLSEIAAAAATAGGLEVFKLKNTKLYCFGDSWTAGSYVETQERFTKILCDILTMQEENYGVAAGGFSYSGSKGAIADGLTKAMRSGSYPVDKELCKMVLITGGVNDYRHKDTVTQTNFRNGVVNFVKDVHAAFPNALIVIGLGNSSINNVTTGYLNWIESAKRDLMSSCNFPIKIIDNFHNFTRGRKTWYIEDNQLLHLTPFGHKMLAGRVASAIADGQTSVHDYIGDIHLDHDLMQSIDAQPYLFLENDMIVINPGLIRFKNPMTGNTKIGYIQPYLAPATSVFFNAYGSGGNVGCVYINGQDYSDPQQIGHVHLSVASGSSFNNLGIGGCSYMYTGTDTP